VNLERCAGYRAKQLERDASKNLLNETSPRLTRPVCGSFLTEKRHKQRHGHSKKSMRLKGCCSRPCSPSLRASMAKTNRIGGLVACPRQSGRRSMIESMTRAERKVAESKTSIS